MFINKTVTNKYKTNELSIFLTLPLRKETITKNALLPKVLSRGTKNLKDQVEISKKLENMYGTNLNCGIDKAGDYCILKFYIQCIGNKYVLNNENLAQDGIDLLLDIVFNPLVENDKFDDKIVEQEKENLLQIIQSKKDNKEKYAFNRCIEEMFKNEPYGLYKFGTEEDLANINSKDLYEYYKEMLKQCRIDIFVYGMDAENIQVPKELESLGNIDIVNDNQQSSTNNSNSNGEPQLVRESADVTQGKLIIGLNVPNNDKFAATMYNIVLGGGANSKLFQNVREKQGLAYSAGSMYVRRKDAIFIRTGIELQNFEKTLEVIKEQLEAIRNGNITEDEINAGRELIIASLRMIQESQEDIISFNFDQELFGEKLKINEYIEKLQKVTKDDIIETAKNVKINTIYYLEN